jgi:type I restriction enzyme S subunit
MPEAKTTGAAVPTRRFKPYPAYKDSGVEWLGEIPAHWEVAPVYARYEVALGKMLDAKRVTGESSGCYLRNIDVQWDAVNTEGLPEMDFAPEERDRYLVREGDLLVCEGGEIGRTAIWRGEIAECFYQKAIHRVRPRSEEEAPRFFYYCMYTLAKRGVFAAGGNPNTIDHLTAVQLRHYRLPFASPNEQRAIAAFLDRETGRIDALVAKKERLIELLQEKRTALITRAVTKGLDPNVSMKDSGVEWLGEIPAHWTLRRLKEIVAGIEQGWSPLCENRPADVDEWAVLKVGCVNGEMFDHAEHKALPSDLRPRPEYEIKSGDVLMSRANTRQLLGSAALVRTVRERLLLCDKLYRIRVRPDQVLPDFLVRAFASSSSRFHFEREATGASASMQNVSQDAISNLVVPVPPVAEQRQIVEFADTEAAQLSALAERVHDAMTRLKELRTALISAAVTGKIDVRAG